MKRALQSAPLVLLVLAGCASSVAGHPVAAPVTVVVMAQDADRADAARLRALTEEAIRRSGVRAHVGVVTVQYYGYANAVRLPPYWVGRGPNQFVFAAFTITDGDGNVLDAEWLQYQASEGHLKALRDTAAVIATRLARLSGS